MKRSSKLVRKRPAASRSPGIMKRPAASSADIMQRPAASSTSPPAEASLISAKFRELLDEHLLESMYRQSHLEDIVEGRHWSLCLDPSQTNRYGKLWFGEDMAFECQVLGSESYQSNTWLWAWANPSLPQDLAEAARSLRSSELCQGSPVEFSESQIPLSTVNGHQIAIVSSGMLDAAAYYSGPMGGGVGRIYLVIKDPSFPARASQTAGDVLRLVRCIGQSLETGWLCKPAVAVDTFLQNHGATLLQNGNYEFPEGGSVQLDVAEDGKIRKLGAHVKRA